MQTKYTFIIATALIVIQLAGCKSVQTYGNGKPTNHLSGMGNKNTCNLNNPTKAERKYMAYYDYCEGLKNSYAQNSPADIDNNAVGAGAAYILITGAK